MANKDGTIGSPAGAGDVGNLDPDRSDARTAYRQAVREAEGSNDPDMAFNATKAFVRRFRKTMKRLA